jgi:hypothetical protein
VTLTATKDVTYDRPLRVSLAEEKLIRRLRQLRNQATVAAVVVFLSPLQMNPLGNTEILEPLDAKPEKT